MTGKEIKIKRIQFGIKQKDLAKILGVSRPHLSYVESEKSDGYRVRILAQEYFKTVEKNQ